MQALMQRILIDMSYLHKHNLRCKVDSLSEVSSIQFGLRNSQNVSSEKELHTHKQRMSDATLYSAKGLVLVLHVVLVLLTTVEECLSTKPRKQCWTLEKMIHINWSMRRCNVILNKVRFINGTWQTFTWDLNVNEVFERANAIYLNSNISLILRDFPYLTTTSWSVYTNVCIWNEHDSLYHKSRWKWTMILILTKNKINDYNHNQTHNYSSKTDFIWFSTPVKSSGLTLN